MNKFRNNPTSPGINYEKLSACRDKKICSVRIDDTYRGIVVREQETGVYLLLWIDHHDEAYEWAKQNGYIEADYTKYCLPDGSHNTVLSTPELSAQEMVDFCNMARKKYYLRIGYILHRMKIGLTDFNDLKRSLKAFGRLKHYLFK